MAASVCAVTEVEAIEVSNNPAVPSTWIYRRGLSTCLAVLRCTDDKLYRVENQGRAAMRQCMPPVLCLLRSFMSYSFPLPRARTLSTATPGRQRCRRRKGALDPVLSSLRSCRCHLPSSTVEYERRALITAWIVCEVFRAVQRL
jgi:hypothetical protein